MWHPESLKEEWARRKTYLIRSLFDDVPMLSTISEEDESISQNSPAKISGKPLLPRHLDTRRLSPLPDLIIEIVPRRLKQDEPEEFYISLEKEMKKLYMRDYLNIYSTSSSEDIESVSNPRINDDYADYGCDSENLRLESSKDSLEEEESDYDNLNETGEQRLSQTFEIINFERTDSIDSREDIEPHASISNEITNADKDESIGTIKLQNESSKTFRLSPSFDENYETHQEEASKVSEYEESERLAKKSGASSHDSYPSASIPEPDEIRRLEKRMSSISLPDRYSKSFQEGSWEFQNKRLSMMIDQDISDEVIASGKKTQIAEESPDISEINVTSTPKSIRRVKKNRYEPYSYVSSTSKIQNYNQDRALQTSFSDEENYCDLWRNFFMGTPKFFRLI